MWLFGKQRRSGNAARHSSRRSLKRRNQLSRSNGFLERLEDRRLLAITAMYDGVTDTLTFTGDAGDNLLVITANNAESSNVNFFSPTDTITLVGATNPQPDVAAIIVNLDGGTNDSLRINGSADADNISINGTTVTFVSALPVDVTYTLTDVENLIVNSALNNDTISATGVSVTGNLDFSGGDGTDNLSIVGPLTAGSLSVNDDNADDVTLSGSGVLGIITTGDQTYNVPVTLVATTTLNGNDISFNSTVDSAVTNQILEINTAGGGVTTFGGPVGGILEPASIVTNADGRTAISAATIELNGASVEFNDPVLLTANLVITEIGAGNVTFNSTIDSAAGNNFTLEVITAAGATIFNGQVGGDSLGALSADTGLGAVTTNATGTTQINGGLVTTTGDQTYDDPVTLGMNTFVNGMDIFFNNTLNSAAALAFSLVVNSSGTGFTTFGGIVGGAAGGALGNLTTNPDGFTRINGGGAVAVTTTGDQTYGDAVTLGADTTLAGNDISFNGTLNSDGVNRILIVNTAGGGVTTFGGQVGVTLPLASLTTNADGTTRLNAGILNTTGDQTYNDAVLVGADTALTASSGNITFVTFVDAANNSVALTSDFGLTVNTPNLTAVAGKGNNIFNAEVGGGFVAGADPDGLEFLITDDTGVSAGQTTFNFFVPSPNTVLTTLAQEYNDAVILVQNSRLTSSAGNITFNSFVDSRDNALAGTSLASLTVNTPAGDNIFNAQVGGNNQTLLSLPSDVDGLEFLITDDTGVTGGRTRFNVAAPFAARTAGRQLYQDDVLLEADTLLFATTAVAPASADITFERTVRSSVDGVNGLIVNADDVTTFQGKVGDNSQRLEFLATNLPGTTRIAINTLVGEVSINTLLDQTYNEPIIFESPTDLSVLQGQNIAFNNTIGGAVANTEDVTVTVSNEANFNAAIDLPATLRSLRVTGTAAGAEANLRFPTFTVGTDMFFGVPVFLDSPTDATTFTAGGDVTFDSTVDGAMADVEDLTVDASDDTSLNGSVGTLGRLDELLINKNNAGNPGETTFLRGAVIQTGDDQTYDERVEINAAANQVALTAGADIRFSATVDSEVADQDRLQAQAGTTITFNGDVGVIKRLESLFAEALNGDVEFRRIDALNTVEIDADVAATAKVEDLDASAGDLDVRAAALIARSRNGINLDTDIGALTALNSGPAGDPSNATDSISIREANAIDVLSVINNAATGGDVAIITGGNVMSIFNVSAIGFFVGAVTELNTPAQDDDILVFGSIITGGAISMQAGDDMTLGVGSDVESLNSFIYMNIDSASADAAGGTAILAGDIEADSAFQYPIFVQGGANDDLFSLQKLPLSPIALAAEGGSLDNAFILTTDAPERVNVFATIVDIVGRPLITYVNNEQLDLVTLGGDDRVFVQMPEPTHGALANIVRTSTGAGDDSLKINGSTLADTIRINDYTTDGNYRFQVRGDTGETECLQVFGFTGNDIIENSAHIASLLDGGNGQDHITGSDFANVFDASTGTLREIYDVIFGGADADSLVDSGRPGLSGRGGNDFLYADHDYNNGAPVQLIADGDFVNGGTGRDVIIALGADTLQRDAGDFESDIVVGQGLNLTTNDFLFATFLPPNAGNINAQLQRGLDKKCAMPIP